MGFQETIDQIVTILNNIGSTINPDDYDGLGKKS